MKKEISREVNELNRLLKQINKEEIIYSETPFDTKVLDEKRNKKKIADIAKAEQIIKMIDELERTQEKIDENLHSSIMSLCNFIEYKRK